MLLLIYIIIILFPSPSLTCESPDDIEYVQSSYNVLSKHNIDFVELNSFRSNINLDLDISGQTCSPTVPLNVIFRNPIDFINARMSNLNKSISPKYNSNPIYSDGNACHITKYTFNQLLLLYAYWNLFNQLKSINLNNVNISQLSQTDTLINFFTTIERMETHKEIFNNIIRFIEHPPVLTDNMKYGAIMLLLPNCLRDSALHNIIYNDTLLRQLATNQLYVGMNYCSFDSIHSIEYFYKSFKSNYANLKLLVISKGDILRRPINQYFTIQSEAAPNSYQSNFMNRYVYYRVYIEMDNFLDRIMSASYKASPLYKPALLSYASYICEFKEKVISDIKAESVSTPATSYEDIIYRFKELCDNFKSIYFKLYSFCFRQTPGSPKVNLC